MVARRRCPLITSPSAHTSCMFPRQYPWRTNSQCCHDEKRSTDTKKRPSPTERHISRCRSRSISRTMGLFRTSFLIAYSNVSAVIPSHLADGGLRRGRRERYLHRETEKQRPDTRISLPFLSVSV